MNKTVAESRLTELKSLMEQYSYEYYVLDAPTVSDAVYDGLMQELKKLEAAFPELITPDSPTQRVGGEALDGFQKVAHSTRMLSLNDVFSHEDVEAWVKRIKKVIPDAPHQYFCDLKMDGLACALIYEDGVLVQAITRGDGFVGEDVTHNVRTIKNVPLRLRASDDTRHFLVGRTEVRGEIIMYKRDFEAINRQREKEGLPVFMNPRNLAAGTIRQLDPQLVAARPLRFHAYDLIREDAQEVASYVEAYKVLSTLGVTINQQATCLETTDEVMQFVRTWDDQRQSLPYITDGLVIKINYKSLYRQLGVVGKNPRGAVAYKYPAEEATTVVKDIVISIGRTGAATPVAVFDPVLVSGSTVQHASLHNADEIERKDVRVGDTVVIYKAGDIIPQVQKVILELRPNGSKRFNFERELSRQYPDLEFDRPKGEAVYRVKNTSGPLILKRSLQHYASKGALDIDTLGEKNVNALVDAGLVQDIADIYSLSVEQLLTLDRFADVSAQKLVSAIQAAKKPVLPRFLYGLGIRHVGVQTAIDLSQRFKRLDSIGTASLDDLKSVEGVGDIVADSVYLWFDEQENQQLLAKFRSLGVWPLDALDAKGPLSGKSFVVTGTLESMSRDEAADKIRAAGGTFQTSVGKTTDYLVAGKNVGASKLAKAEKLGITVIDEASFQKILN